MKIKITSILFLIALATDVSSAATKPSIYVGPMASGEAVRILRTRYVLQPLTNSCPSCLGIVVGPADLSKPWVVARLRAAYEAGHAVGVTNATIANIRRLHDLLGHRGSAEPVPSGKQVDLIAFRKAQRSDGRFHFSSHVLLPRLAAVNRGPLLTEKDKNQLKRVSSKWVKQKLRQELVKERRQQRKQQIQRARDLADSNDIKALSRVFSARPHLPAPPPGDPQQNLINLAESYESHAVQTDSSYGDQVQLVNIAYAARSFLNSSDFYYVLQESSYKLGLFPCQHCIESWINSTSAVAPYSGLTLLQPVPGTTMEATQISSTVSKSIGNSVGFNTSQGLDASVTSTTTISNTKSTTVPATTVTNGADFVQAQTAWTFQVNDIASHFPGDVLYDDQWIWQVPFSSYSPSDPPDLFFNTSAFLNVNLSGLPDVNLQVELSPSVPWPFGRTFSLQPPVVTGVSPSCVNSGDSFIIEGSAFYPSLVQSVEIGGTPVSPDSITKVSDTQLEIIAPDTILCHGEGCAVSVQTTQGTSNTNFNIVISDFCF